MLLAYALQEKGFGSMSKSKVRVLVIGTRHELQRHQDTAPEREKVRAEFDKLLRQIIKKQKIGLIAEEAGDDTAVWEKLKQVDEMAAEFGGLFGGYPAVDNPVPTIAKKIADERKTRHIDIRAANADVMTIGQRDEAMTAKIMEVLGTDKRVLVIVGESHRTGVAQRLKDAGLSVGDFRFPESA